MQRGFTPIQTKIDSNDFKSQTLTLKNQKKFRQFYALIQVIAQKNCISIHDKANVFCEDKQTYDRIRQIARIIQNFICLESIEKTMYQLKQKNNQGIQFYILKEKHCIFKNFLVDFQCYKSTLQKTLNQVKELTNQKQHLKSIKKINSSLENQEFNKQNIKYQKLVNAIILIKYFQYEEFLKQNNQKVFENQDLKKYLLQICSIVYSFNILQKIVSDQLQKKIQIADPFQTIKSCSFTYKQQTTLTRKLFNHFKYQQSFIKYLTQKLKYKRNFEGLIQQSQKEDLKHVFFYNREPLKQLQYQIKNIIKQYCLLNYQFYQNIVLWYKRIKKNKSNPTNVQILEAINSITQIKSNSKQQGLQEMVFSSDDQNQNQNQKKQNQKLHKKPTLQKKQKPYQEKKPFFQRKGSGAKNRSQEQYQAMILAVDLKQKQLQRIRNQKDNLLKQIYENRIKKQQDENQINAHKKAKQLVQQQCKQNKKTMETLQKQIQELTRFLQSNIKKLEDKELFTKKLTQNLNIISKEFDQYKIQKNQEFAKKQNQFKLSIENNQKKIKTHFQGLFQKQKDQSTKKHEELNKQLQNLFQQLNLTKTLLIQKEKQLEIKMQPILQKQIQIQILQKISSKCFCQKIFQINPAKTKISSINLIYKYKENSNQVFSKFAKDKKNLLVVGRTKLGQIIGGFTSQGFGNQVFNNDGYGFLFSGLETQNFQANQLNFYLLKNQSKTPSQCIKDQIRFGYRQLIIKSGIVESDFASPRHQSRGHYLNVQKHSKQFFLKSSSQNQAVELLDFEIYQIIFDNQILLQSKDLQALNNKIDNLNVQIQILKSETEKNKKQKCQQNQAIKQLQEKITQFKIEKQNLTNLIEKLRKELTQHQQQKNQLIKNNELQRQKNTNFQQEFLHLQSKRKKSMQELKHQSLEQSKQLTKLLNQKKQQFNQMTELIKKLKKQNQILNEKLQNLLQKSQCQQVVDWQKLHNQERQKNKYMQNQHINIIESLNKQIAENKINTQNQLSNIKEQLNTKITILNKEIQDKKAQFQSALLIVRSENESLKKKINQIKLREETKIQTIQELQSKLLTNRCYQQFFEGDIFDNLPYNKLQWFVDTLQETLYKTIKKTRLVYKKDDFSNVNFHNYFDNKEDIVLLVHLKNGRTIGAYTHPPFIKGEKHPGETGLIISFHQKQVFHLKQIESQQMDPKPRPTTYDEYFMIFGNSQIRLRFRQELLFSNFGVQNAFYNNRKFTVDCLLGQGKERQSEIQTYEIYQLKF